MKKRLQEIEEEAGALREMQAKVEKQTGVAQGSLHLLWDMLLCSGCLCWFIF